MPRSVSSPGPPSMPRKCCPPTSLPAPSATVRRPLPGPASAPARDPGARGAPDAGIKQAWEGVHVSSTADS